MRFLIRGVGTMLLVSLAGCAFSRPIAVDAVAYNEDLATAQNEVLLLNVARASMKHPLFFTTVSEVSRTLGSKAGLTGDVPWGAAEKKVNVMKPTLEVSGGPTAKVAVLDTEKFMRGITTPISLDTFAFYWNQGWPKEVLLSILVRRFEDRSGIVKDGPTEARLFVHSDRTAAAAVKEYGDFQANLFKLLKRYQMVEVETLPGTDAMGARACEVPTPADLVAAAKEGVSIEPDGTTYKVVGKPTRRRLKFSKPLNPSNEPAQDAKETFAADSGAEGQGTASANGALYLRSVEGIIYHLGEMARVEREFKDKQVAARVFRSKEKKDGVPLFTARGTGCNDPCAVSVCYCGETLIVPSRPSDGESMHVLSLLSQLLALHKSADELPKGGVVTLVGN